MTLGSESLVAIVAVSDAKPSPVVNIVWMSSGHHWGSSTSTMQGSGWFVYAETPSRIWVFDGKALSLQANSDDYVAAFDTQSALEHCPSQVRQALPQQLWNTCKP
jgi:hypothetical protein